MLREFFGQMWSHPGLAPPPEVSNVPITPTDTLAHQLPVPGTSAIPCGVYEVGLYGSDGQEIRGSGYSRKNATFHMAKGGIENGYDIVWPVVSGRGSGWGAVCGVAMFQNGAVCWKGPLHMTRHVWRGDSFMFAAGDLEVTH